MDEQTTRSKSPNQTSNSPEATGEIRDTHQISDVKSWTPIKISIFFNQPQHSPSRLNGPIARRANTEIRDTHQNLRNSGHPSKSHFPTTTPPFAQLSESADRALR